MQKSSLYIAFNRFGYGATPALAKMNIQDPQKWLFDQLRDYSIQKPKWTSEQALKQIFAYRHDRKATPQLAQNNNAIMSLKDRRREMINSSKKLSAQIILQAIQTKQPLQARLQDFFANHFSLSNTNANMRTIAPTLASEAIAPHLNGYFSNMLVSVTRHPAMLYYLNNESSIGPNSALGLKRQKRGLNENLGREILELHTLGVAGGYTQSDVQALSKSLTGWSIGGRRKREPLGFVFRANAHEPGDKILLGKRYAAETGNSEQQAVNMLNNLANHEHTARHLAYKLAKHFIADSPPQALIEQMAKRWVETNGHIPSIIITMIKHPLSWSPKSSKFKTPREYVISLQRACQLSNTKPDILKSLEILGQAPYSSGSPAGFSDNAQDWASASALMNRIEWAEHVAGQVKMAPIDVAKAALGDLLSPSTAQHIMRAESKQQGLAMLFMSPEFLRR
jgi:uncharacterized protein (DUF1800 family)